MNTPSSHNEKSVLNDGKLDLGATIRQRVRLVRTSELAARVDNLQLISMSTIRQLLTEAVDAAVARLRPQLVKGAMKRCQQNVREIFAEKVAALQARNEALESKVQELALELESAQTALDLRHRSEAHGQGFAAPEDMLANLEDKLEEAFQRFGAATSQRGQQGRDFRNEVIRLLKSECDEMRERRRQEEKDQSSKIALLERKARRLASALDATSKERDGVRKELQMARDTLQGMKFGSPVSSYDYESKVDRELKHALMKELFEFNQDLRQILAAAERDRRSGSGRA
jgi:hypothetical protein